VRSGNKQTYSLVGIANGSGRPNADLQVRPDDSVAEKHWLFLAVCPGPRFREVAFSPDSLASIN
jgi:hypothetical protein